MTRKGDSDSDKGTGGGQASPDVTVPSGTAVRKLFCQEGDFKTMQSLGGCWQTHTLIICTVSVDYYTFHCRFQGKLQGQQRPLTFIGGQKQGITFKVS